ncbi:MAG: hypothetical protein AB7I27_00030 [Bacteriovoracaceae bacterium]
MSNIYFLLAFYFVTSFGSLLALISTFLAAESIFGSLSHLAIALSLRTIVSLCSSFFAPKIFSHFGIKKTLVIAEIFGIFSLGILYLGTTKVNFLMAVIGLSALALPANLASQGVISLVKLNCTDGTRFSTLSAFISKWLGMADIVGGLLSPILFLSVKLDGIYLIDLLSYLIGLSLLIFFKSSNEASIGSDKKIISLFQFLKKDNFSHIQFLFGTLALIGMVPILSGSGNFQAHFGTGLISKSQLHVLWATEGVGFLISGFIYNNRNLRLKLFPLFLISIIPLSIAVLLKNYYLLIFACIWITISYDVLFKARRDEFLLRSKNIAKDVIETTASFSIIKSLFCSVSPLLIVFLLNSTSIIGMLFILFIIQLIIVILHFSRKDTLRFMQPKSDWFS